MLIVVSALTCPSMAWTLPHIYTYQKGKNEAIREEWVVPLTGNKAPWIQELRYRTVEGFKEKGEEAGFQLQGSYPEAGM